MISSFAIALAALTSPSFADCGCSADVNGDSMVNGADIAIVLGYWGPASSTMPGADIDADGSVNAQDLGILLAEWGECLGPPSIVTEPLAIKALAKAAYVWSLPLEFTYRFGIYNTLMTAEVNTLAYVPAPPAWNNAATNAGNASVLYINGILDLTGDTAWVYTIPNPTTNYTVSQFLDAFINTFANPGSRTTPTTGDPTPTSYLVVGPDSPYAHSKTVVIQGHEFPVIASDTNRAQVLARVLTPTLLPASDPDSAYHALLEIAQKFRLNTLEEFLASGAVPPAGGFDIKVPTEAERAEAANWQNSPDNALDFFGQVGVALQLNDLPTQSTGLGGTAIATLPAWVVPQPGAGRTYYAPSAGQRGALALFGPIGLSESGFRIPCNWGDAQIAALQEGWAEGVTFIQDQLDHSATAATNWWTYKNSKWGTYQNSLLGYETRAVGVISGGFPSLVADGLYAAQFTEANSTDPLTGDNTYALTFRASDGATLPADGTQPPMMLKADGTQVGFWSLTVYQPGHGEAACPCLPQASVLNTHYSQAVTDVVSVNAKSGYITAKVPFGATLVASSPVLFGAAAAEYGLQPNVAYFIVNTPVVSGDTVTFQVSATWLQRLSTAAGDPGTPVQYSGEAGPVATLMDGVSLLKYGIVQPVSQLGSSEINRGQLRQNVDESGNPDGTYTIWLAPVLPTGAFIENWIPTPSQKSLAALYPDATVLNSDIWPVFRVYAAQVGSMPPSILPCLDCASSDTVGGDQSGSPFPDDALLATYRFPLMQKLPPSQP